MLKYIHTCRNTVTKNKQKHNTIIEPALIMHNLVEKKHETGIPITAITTTQHINNKLYTPHDINLLPSLIQPTWMRHPARVSKNDVNPNIKTINLIDVRLTSLGKKLDKMLCSASPYIIKAITPNAPDPAANSDIKSVPTFKVTHPQKFSTSAK